MKTATKVKKSRKAARKRREPEGKRETQGIGEPGAVARDTSQLRFPHWWNSSGFKALLNEGEIALEEQKASLWYEAARRRREVQEAWRGGKFRIGGNGWQLFTSMVVEYLRQPWPDLDPYAQRLIVETSYSPTAVPPAGYSTSPTAKKDLRRVSMKLLRAPEPGDEHAARAFVDEARRLEDAGFIIAAVDKKQNQATRAAFEAIQALPSSFRKADSELVMHHHLPPGISDADIRSLEEKQREGRLKEEDFQVLWRKYPVRTNDLNAPWHTTAELKTRLLYKRMRAGKHIEGKKFVFETICHQLEASDRGEESDFVRAVRL